MISPHPLAEWHARPYPDEPKIAVLQAGIVPFVSKCCFEGEREIKRIRRLRDSGKTQKNIRGQSRRAALTFRLRLYSTLKAAKKKGKKLTFEVAADRANSARNFNSPNEAYSTSPLKKNSAGKRKIFKFGPVRQVQQELLLDLLKATTSIPKNDYGLSKRRGTHGAIRKIRNELIAGKRYWATTDIKNAFPSITTGHAIDVTSVDKHLLHSIGFHHSYQETVRPELPQGGKHSSFICSAVIDGVLREIGEHDVAKATFADNVAIGATTIERVCTALHQIEQQFATLGAGPLLIHKTCLHDGYVHNGKSKFKGYTMLGGVWFCGYKASYDILDMDVRIRPNFEAFKRLEIRINRKFLRFLTVSELEILTDEIVDQDDQHWLVEWVTNNWARSAYPEWTWNDGSANSLLTFLYDVVESERCRRLGISKPY